MRAGRLAPRFASPFGVVVTLHMRDRSAFLEFGLSKGFGPGSGCPVIEKGGASPYAQSELGQVRSMPVQILTLPMSSH